MTTISNVESYQDQLRNLLKQLEGMLPADKLAVFHRDAEQLGKAYPVPLKLQKGDKAPNFSLPNPAGKKIELAALLKNGPVVLTFYRGVWCPYCNLQLKMYQQILPQIKEAGASLVAISPMTPDSSKAMVDGNELQFEVLTDEANRVAQQYTTVITNLDSSIQAMADLGYDFHGFNQGAVADIPVPATFVIDPSGKVRFAASEGGDYRHRVEPIDILAQLDD